MVKGVGSLLLVCAAIAVASSCASIPPRVEQDDCLVVIKNEIEMSGGSARFIFDYYLGLSLDHREVVVPKSKDYIAIVVKEPNVRVKTIIARLSTGGLANGSDHYGDVDLLLPYRPGQVVVTNFAIVRKVIHSGNGYSDYLTLREFSNDEQDGLRRALSEDKNFATWTDARDASR